jgi:hypothetical protein
MAVQLFQVALTVADRTLQEKLRRVEGKKDEEPELDPANKIKF